MYFLKMAVIFLLAVFTAVDFVFFIGENEDVGEFLFDGGDTSRILALDNVFDLFWEGQFFFIDQFSVFDDIDRDIVVNKSEYI